MASHEYGLLDQAEEGKLKKEGTRVYILTLHSVDQVHKSRLLSIEDRAFKRITKRLLAADSLISASRSSLPTPPPDSTGTDDGAVADADLEKQTQERSRWREEMLLDFAAFESSIVRIQLLRTSNERERERYAAEKVRILETAQAIKQSTADLRVQLEESQKQLALRKTYDELAEKITGNRLLRPREEQQAQLEKLEAEIAELEQESREYARTWAERREQFGRIVEEGRQMLRLIRDEKEEAERKEGMEGGDDADEAGGSPTREASTAGTPGPDQGESTPLHMSHEGSARLHVHNDRLAPPSARTGTSSRDRSPADPDNNRRREGELDDTYMGEGGAGLEQGEEVESDIEEGEEAESPPHRDDMDTT